ncbi:hypothetical protein J6590_092679 [Homalodisca vitripennis]|nr:hypothetical protein J6590_092679 [Homalodisca vitripennis]
MSYHVSLFYCAATPHVPGTADEGDDDDCDDEDCDDDDCDESYRVRLRPIPKIQRHARSREEIIYDGQCFDVPAIPLNRFLVNLLQRVHLFVNNTHLRFVPCDLLAHPFDRLFGNTVSTGIRRGGATGKLLFHGGQLVSQSFAPFVAQLVPFLEQIECFDIRRELVTHVYGHIQIADGDRSVEQVHNATRDVVGCVGCRKNGRKSVQGFSGPPFRFQNREVRASDTTVSDAQVGWHTGAQRFHQLVDVIVLQYEIGRQEKRELLVSPLHFSHVIELRVSRPYQLVVRLPYTLVDIRFHGASSGRVKPLHRLYLCHRTPKCGRVGTNRPNASPRRQEYIHRGDRPVSQCHHGKPSTWDVRSLNGIMSKSDWMSRHSFESSVFRVYQSVQCA